MLPRFNSRLLKRISFNNGKDETGFLNLHFGDLRDGSGCECLLCQHGALASNYLYLHKKPGNGDNLIILVPDGEGPWGFWPASPGK